jgi:hypothetical protein
MIGDFLTTNYVISNKIGYEGNPFMAEVVNSPLTFLIIKLICTGLIISMIGWSLKRNEKIAGYGMKTILFLMLLVVLNNSIIIGSAFESWTLQNPVSFDSPGEVWDGVSNTEYLYSNGTETVGFACLTNGTTFSIPGCGATKRFIKATGLIALALTDWTTNAQQFILLTNGNVLRINGNQVDYTAGTIIQGQFSESAPLMGTVTQRTLIGAAFHVVCTWNSRTSYYSCVLTFSTVITSAPLAQENFDFAISAIFPEV